MFMHLWRLVKQYVLALRQDWTQVFENIGDMQVWYINYFEWDLHVSVQLPNAIKNSHSRHICAQLSEVSNPLGVLGSGNCPWSVNPKSNTFLSQREFEFTSLISSSAPITRLQGKPSWGQFPCLLLKLVHQQYKNAKFRGPEREKTRASLNFVAQRVCMRVSGGGGNHGFDSWECVKLLLIKCWDHDSEPRSSFHQGNAIFIGLLRKAPSCLAFFLPSWFLHFWLPGWPSSTTGMGIAFSPEQPTPVG